MANTAKPIPMRTSKDEHVSVSVRKIDNGFIARHAISGPKGYSEREVFHATKPNVQVGAAVVKKAAPKKASKRGYR